MKLSSLVAYKNLLDNLTPIDAIPLTHEKLGPILHTVATHGIQFNDLIRELKDDYEHINSAFTKFDDTIEKVKDELASIISNQESAYFQESYRLYDQEMVHDSAEYILNRRPDLEQTAFDFIKGRISLYGDWHHAGLIIRPGREDWIRQLVGCDPLYLVDVSNELLDPAILKFNRQYQRRLRSYVIQESSDHTMLDNIPDNQFGFCLAYNFFNFKPFEVIKCYLIEVYKKLKNGGTFAITFNDCDRAAGVELAERSFMCYTPGTMVLNLARSIGYEVRQTFHADAANCWVELRKPGTLTSIRGGQSLAEIVAKSK